MTDLFVSELPYLTHDIPGFECSFKNSSEDFYVEEIPAYLPSGEGEHLYLWIEKINTTTKDAIQELARFLKVSRHAISSAGLKDKQAVTRQWLSCHLVKEEQLANWSHPSIKILEKKSHRNKLRIGHLRGNRFKIKLRNFNDSEIENLNRFLEMLTKRGVPNYYGVQRFGLNDSNWQIGQAYIKKDYETMCRFIAGSSEGCETGAVAEARRLFDEEKYEESFHAWPKGFRESRMIASVMARKNDFQKAVAAMGKDRIWFYITAFQSYLFNQVLAKRLESFDELQLGDLAWKHDNGAVFKVQDVEKDKERVQNFELSPSGPIFGCEMTEAEGVPGELEGKVLQQAQLALEDFRGKGSLKCRGARRPLRFQMQESSMEQGSDENGNYIELSFSLDAGCYATTVLREIGKEKLKDSSKLKDKKV